MKPARIGGILLVLLAIMALGGCVNLKQEIWLNPDGSGKMAIDMGVSKPLMDIASSGPAASRDPFQTLKELYESPSNPLVKNLSTRQYTENDMEHYAVAFEVTDLGQYFDQQAARPQGGMAGMSLKKQANGNLVFIQRLDPGGPDSDRAGLNLSGATASQMETLFKDQYWTVVLHAAGVVKADPTGSIQEGAAVEWKIPIARLVTSQTAIQLTAELKPQTAVRPGADFSLIALLLAAGTGVGLLLFLRRRRTRPQDETGPHPYAPYPPASRPDREG
jgi:hypothetical protein